MIPGSWVIVTGASGLVGNHVVEHLLETGRNVIAVSRHPDKANVMERPPERYIHASFDLLTGEGNLPDVAAIEGFIHAASVERGQDAALRNVEMARTVVVILNTFVIPRCVLISCRSDAKHSASEWTRVSRLCETVVKRDFLGCLHVVYPTMVYGPRGNSTIQRLSRQLASGRPSLSGAPRWSKMQPVAAADIAHIIRILLDRDTPETIAVHGRDVVSHHDLAMALCQRAGRLVGAMPRWMTYVLAKINKNARLTLEEAIDHGPAADGACEELKARFGLQVRGIKDDLDKIAFNLTIPR